MYQPNLLNDLFKLVKHFFFAIRAMLEFYRLTRLHLLCIAMVLFMANLFMAMILFMAIPTNSQIYFNNHENFSLASAWIDLNENRSQVCWQQGDRNESGKIDLDLERADLNELHEENTAAKLIEVFSKRGHEHLRLVCEQFEVTFGQDLSSFITTALKSIAGQLIGDSFVISLKHFINAVMDEIKLYAQRLHQCIEFFTRDPSRTFVFSKTVPIIMTADILAVSDILFLASNKDLSYFIEYSIGYNLVDHVRRETSTVAHNGNEHFSISLQKILECKRSEDSHTNTELIMDDVMKLHQLPNAENPHDIIIELFSYRSRSHLRVVFQRTIANHLHPCFRARSQDNFLQALSNFVCAVLDPELYYERRLDKSFDFIRGKNRKSFESDSQRQTVLKIIVSRAEIDLDNIVGRLRCDF